MEKVDIHTGKATATIFISKIEANLEGTGVNELYDVMREFQKTWLRFKDSNWRFQSIIAFEMHTMLMNHCEVILIYPLPKLLVSKKAIINMQHSDG